MKKPIKTFFCALAVAFALVLSCLFFPLRSGDISSAKIIEGVSGNKFILTGLVGYNTEHFFENDLGESTLVGAEARKGRGEYFNIVSTNYQPCSGYSELTPTTDMQPFIAGGLLYAKASAEFTLLNARATISISSAGETIEASTDQNGRIETPLLPITEFERIKFSFRGEMAENASIYNLTMIEPTIHLYTIIDSVWLDSQDQIVSPGQIVDVHAHNAVTDISGKPGNFMNFSKVNHEIKYEFISGGEWVKIVNSKLVISKDAPDGAVIELRVFSKANSFSPDDKVVSDNTIKLTVSTELIPISVRKDFENPATIIGEGSFKPGKSVTLTIIPRSGYEFVGWYEDGVFKSKEYKEAFTVTAGKDIYARFIKTIKISQIDAQPREYDGTTFIDPSSVAVTFDGLEEGHELGVEGVSYEYFDSNAGKGKLIRTDFEKLILVGKDADIYSLVQTLPQAQGEVLSRKSIVSAQTTSKEYRYADPQILFTASNFVGEEVVEGMLGRAEGEAIGRYAITLGNLEQANPNYDFSFDDESVYFEILPRKVAFGSVSISDKVYDGSTDAELAIAIANVVNGEDVRLEVAGNFVTANAGYGVEVRIIRMTLVGEDRGNYSLVEFEQQLYGNIQKRPITIRAKSCTRVYGDELAFEYDVDGLVLGDILEGVLGIDNVHVGQRQITIGTLSGENYIISFGGATCEIVPKRIQVVAKSMSKTYGDDNFALEYDAMGLVGEDTLSGSLEREAGEEVGEYAILIGSLGNPDYEIDFISQMFRILPREITVKILFLDKEYDGTIAVEFDAEFENNIKYEDFVLSLSASLLCKDCGEREVISSDESVSGENIQNYTFRYEYLNNTINVAQRKASVFLNDDQKSYGDKDPAFKYTVNGLIDGESLDLRISRREGEDVGLYPLVVEEEINNLNYEISVISGNLSIVARHRRISIKNQIKAFGEADPVIEFNILDPLFFEDTIEKICDGVISREQGERVGIYSYDTTSLSSSKNYIFDNVEDSFFIINKRPVTVTALSTTKTYGEDDPVFGYRVEGEVKGTKFTVQIIRGEYGENVGEYELDYAASNDDWYYIAEFHAGTLTIEPSPIRIKADEKVKVYGGEEPQLTVSIVSGFLKHSDRLEEIITGKLHREAGEDVGVYAIDCGDLSLGSNYRVEFEEGVFRVIQRHLVIKAHDIEKTYGEIDPAITFSIGGDGLAFGDEIGGSLSRKPGETVGSYEILDNIEVGDNYYYDFIGGTFEIVKRKIQIIPTTLSKQYGDEDSALRYKIEGGLIEGDVLEGELYRDRDTNPIEGTGKYLIRSTLFNPNYDISLVTTYFTITPREIVVRAKSYSIDYGDAVPEFDYEIVMGTLLDGDSISGSLYCTGGHSAGTYDIMSDLSIGRNYTIIYLKGTLEVAQLELVIESGDYSKTYGREDPKFNYQIVSGELLGGDVLYGTLTREAGEDVGQYQLISGIYNANYKITLLPARLEIVKKDVFMISSIYDKIFDGTTVAHLKNPYVSGIIDDVYLDYDINNSADFAVADAGQHIAVSVHDVVLVGEKSGNYNLILPEGLYANITLQSISNERAMVVAKDPVLQDNYSLNFSSGEVSKTVKNHKVVLEFKLWLESSREMVETDSSFRIIVRVSQEIFNKNNIVVYQKDEAGNLKAITSEKGEDGQLIISAATLGDFYIAIEDETWIDYGSVASVGILALLIVIAIVVIVKKQRRIRRKSK